jgi:hypothetical protein
MPSNVLRPSPFAESQGRFAAMRLARRKIMARSVVCLALMLAFTGAAFAAEEATPPVDATDEKPTQGKVIKIEIIGEKAVMPTSGGDDGEVRTRRLTPQQRAQRQREVQRRWRRPEASDVRRAQP